jgi:transcriptional regulator of acetoin/glycerol metabolism
LHLPPLRLRADKAFVIGRVLQQEAQQIGLQAKISEAAQDILLNFTWPGNIRELRNVIRFALAVCDDGHIESHHLPNELQTEGGLTELTQPALLAPTQPVTTLLPSDLCAGMQQAQTLTSALRKHHWNVTAAATELGICRATVYRQMQRYNIVSPKQL